MSQRDFDFIDNELSLSKLGITVGGAEFAQSKGTVRGGPAVAMCWAKKG